YLTMGYNRPQPRTENGFSGKGEPKYSTNLQAASVVAQPISTQLAPQLASFMDQAFKDLTGEYDLILIDATPLLISAETEYLARFADITILVAESGTTRKAQLHRAYRRLVRLNVRGIAAVVNKVGLRRASKATRKDLEDFETHVSRMNLRWRPSPGPATVPPAGFSAAEESRNQENASYV
ncbi:MAG TPA: hypothetical protein VGR96_09065, partial [Acidobacteriaceae bacterium]|nr:hypothetical protein [Acidobacteriaceae bacterium]